MKQILLETSKFFQRLSDVFDDNFGKRNLGDGRYCNWEYSLANTKTDLYSVFCPVPLLIL